MRKNDTAATWEMVGDPSGTLVVASARQSRRRAGGRPKQTPEKKSSTSATTWTIRRATGGTRGGRDAREVKSEGFVGVRDISERVVICGERDL